MKYRAIRSVSVGGVAWEAGDVIEDAPKAAVADWLKIGAIEPMDNATPQAAPHRKVSPVTPPSGEEVSDDG